MDFSMMDALDGDGGVLRNTQGQPCRRDIVQVGGWIVTPACVRECTYAGREARRPRLSPTRGEDCISLCLEWPLH